MTDFHGVYEKYSRDVFRFALYMCGNQAQAEDLTSETFIRLWNATGEIRAGTLKAYLFAIVRNLYVADLRRKSRHTPVDASMADDRVDVERGAAARSELSRVLAALGTLPEPDRAAVLLRADGPTSSCCATCPDPGCSGFSPRYCGGTSRLSATACAAWGCDDPRVPRVELSRIFDTMARGRRLIRPLSGPHGLVVQKAGAEDRPAGQCGMESVHRERKDRCQHEV